MMFADVLGAFAVFLIIFLSGIRKRTRYITKLRDEIEILGSGDLNYEITVKGTEENVEGGMSGECLLTDLADSAESLRLAGFMVEEKYDEKLTEWVAPLGRSVLTRILDNTTSNIMRHADHAKEVVFSCRMREGAINITFANGISPQEKENASGSGIGLDNVRQLVTGSGGLMNVDQRDDKFLLELTFYSKCIVFIGNNKK